MVIHSSRMNGIYMMKGGGNSLPLAVQSDIKGSVVQISLAPVTAPSPHHLAGTSAQGSPLPGSLP